MEPFVFYLKFVAASVEWQQDDPDFAESALQACQDAYLAGAWQVANVTAAQAFVPRKTPAPPGSLGSPGFMVDALEVAAAVKGSLPVLGSRLGAWLQYCRGRKLRLRVGDVEAEAGSLVRWRWRAMASYINRVNKTWVEVELLEAVLTRLADLPADDRPYFEARAFGIFTLLNERGWRGKRLGTMAIAIEFRLTALARLLNADGGRGFTSPEDGTGVAWLHTDLVRCAAEEPLIDQDAQPTFMIESFERRLLSMTATQGQA